MWGLPTTGVLSDAGLIKLRDGVKPTDVTGKDIIENPKHLKFVALDDALLLLALNDIDAILFYSIQAVELHLSYKDAIGLENQKYQYPDVIYLPNEKENSPKIQALNKACDSDAVKNSLSNSYGGKEVLIPAW